MPPLRTSCNTAALSPRVGSRRPPHRPSRPAWTTLGVLGSTEGGIAEHRPPPWLSGRGSARPAGPGTHLSHSSRPGRCVTTLACPRRAPSKPPSPLPSRPVSQLSAWQTCSSRRVPGRWRAQLSRGRARRSAINTHAWREPAGVGGRACLADPRSHAGKEKAACDFRVSAQDRRVGVRLREAHREPQCVYLFAESYNLFVYRGAATIILTGPVPCMSRGSPVSSVHPAAPLIMPGTGSGVPPCWCATMPGSSRRASTYGLLLRHLMAGGTPRSGCLNQEHHAALTKPAERAQGSGESEMLPAGLGSCRVRRSSDAG